jgi:hypothetical protein
VALLAIGLWQIISPSTFGLFFGWPQGGVWSNLAASFLLGFPTVFTILRKQASHHREQLRVLRQQHREHLERLDLHHQRILDAVKAQK